MFYKQVLLTKYKKLNQTPKNKITDADKVRVCKKMSESTALSTLRKIILLVENKNLIVLKDSN